MDIIEKSPYKEVFTYFKEMNQIPRPSGYEKAVSDWLVAFAKDKDLKVIQDEALNVIIKKPGTEGYEDSEILILQGHMDMVPEKAEGSDHDFSKDPIEFIVDGDYVHANNTTLGADNGIAVAYALAILASEDISHPPLEVIITTNEETGMDGAFAFNPEDLDGRRLINLDAEEEGILLTSCAGGIGSVISLGLEKEESSNKLGKEISIGGLFGGHSGMEIHKQRANATQTLARVLKNLGQEVDFDLVSLDGGSKHNAIPRTAAAKVLVADDRSLGAFIEKWNEVLASELRGIDEGINLEVKDWENPSQIAMTKGTRDKLIAGISLVPTGVINMSTDIEGLVQTSNNLGVVITEEDKVTLESSTRSSVKTMRDEVAGRLEMLADLLGAEIEFDAGYPEWEYAKESKLRDVYIEAAKEMYGEDPVVTAIHAGLECGVFSEKYDGKIDLISMGPNLFDVHTPKEKMDIKSAERTFELIKSILAKLK